MVGRGPVRGPGRPCKRCNQGHQRRGSMVSVQVVHSERRAMLLIIRRSWVRAPPAPPRYFPVQAPLTCDDAMFKGASSRFGYAVVCDRKRQYAARCDKYAAKSADVVCARWNVVCLGVMPSNASSSWTWMARATAASCVVGPGAHSRRFGVLHSVCVVPDSECALVVKMDVCRGNSTGGKRSKIRRVRLARPAPTPMPRLRPRSRSGGQRRSS